MAVHLRFALHGPRHNRIFHLIAIDQRKRRNAKPIETLGMFDPRLRPGEEMKKVTWSVDRIRYWLRVGAQPSATVVKLLILGGIIRDPQAQSKNSSEPDSPRDDGHSQSSSPSS